VIRLQRPPNPPSLATVADEQRLGLAHQANPNLDPWRATDVLNALYLASHGKCAYCEADLGAVNIMEVDHFVPKSLVRTLAATWSNLLPSCHDCNQHKGTLDPRKDDFVDPFNADPHDHFYYEHGRFHPRTTHGRQLLTRLQINRRTIKAHATLWHVVSEHIEELYDDLHEIEAGNLTATKRRLSRLRSKALAVLYAATPEAAYSAFVATQLATDRHWPAVETLLRKHAIWDTTLTQYLRQAQAGALPF
jgi:uncharacterized protein (TIGR02646 family)